MNPHEITDEAIVRLVLGEGAQADNDRTRAAVASSAEGQARYQLISSTIADIRRLKADAPSLRVSAEVISRIASHTTTWIGPSRAMPEIRQVLDRAREFIATIVFDSFRAPGLVGVRGAAPARLLKLESDQGSVELRIEPDETREMSIVAGQVQARSAYRKVRIYRHETGGLQEADISAEGFFDFETPSGVYALRLEGADENSLVIDRLELKA